MYIVHIHVYSGFGWIAAQPSVQGLGSASYTQDALSNHHKSWLGKGPFGVAWERIQGEAHGGSQHELGARAWESFASWGEGMLCSINHSDSCGITCPWGPSFGP